MTDHGTIFHPSMVKALRDGRKTQTRRMITPQPELISDAGTPRFHVYNRHGGIVGATEEEVPAEQLDFIPYAVGDRLYVKEGLKRETLARNGMNVTAYALDGAPCVDGWKWQLKTISSRYMPKALSRMTLHVTAVRVERLQAITPDDCRAEGHPQRPQNMHPQQVHDDAARDWYMDLMDDLHGKGFWASNPWVAVLTFEVEHANIGSARP